MNEKDKCILNASQSELLPAENAAVLVAVHMVPRPYLRAANDDAHLAMAGSTTAGRSRVGAGEAVGGQSLCTTA